MTPDQYCQEKAVSSGSSFYYSFLFLSPERRRGITALYAFCREVDDIVDECSDDAIAATSLNWWRQEVERMYLNQAQHPVGKALTPIIAAFNLPKQYFHDIIDGMEMDLTKHRYETYEELKEYCYRVASVVGLLSAAVFGFKDSKTLEYAADLGTAFQLTNIARDVGEDARRNRIYLPLEDLRRFNVSENDILQLNETEEFYTLMDYETRRANQYYHLAMSHLPDSDRWRQLPGLIMSSIYQTVLREIQEDGFHVLNGKTRLTPLRKFWIAWKTMRSERRNYKALASTE